MSHEFEGVPGGYPTVHKLVMAIIGELSKSERKVARALMARYPSAALTTVSDLAELADVSAPTVVRFVHRLGFSGFPALQRALVRELNTELGSPLRQYAAKTGRSTSSVLETSHTALADVLAASYDEVPISEFDALADLLADRTRTLRITGGRFSRCVSDYLALHLKMLRPGVTIVGPEDIDRRTAIADADVSTLVVVYDYRRYTEYQLVFAEKMAGRGATVALLTDNWLSPISRIAQVVLPARVDSSSPFDSLVASMALTESLVAAVAERLGDTALGRLGLLENAE